MSTSLSFAPLTPAWPPQHARTKSMLAPAHTQVRSGGLLSVFCFELHEAGLGTAAMRTRPPALA